MKKENNTDESGFSENDIPDLNSLKLLNQKQTSKILTVVRSSQQRCSVTKGVHRNFAKFTGKHLCQSLFLNKVSVLSPATLLKKRFWHRCFPVNFAKFLTTPFL